MKKNKNISLSDAEQIAIEVALRHYLNGNLDLIQANGYHPASNIAATVRVFNKVQNLQQGSHVDFAVDRVPTFLGHVPEVK